MKLNIALGLWLLLPACVPPASPPSPSQPDASPPDASVAPPGDAQGLSLRDLATDAACGRLAALGCAEAADGCVDVVRDAGAGCILAAWSVDEVRACGVACR